MCGRSSFLQSLPMHLLRSLAILSSLSFALSAQSPPKAAPTPAPTVSKNGPNWKQVPPAPPHSIALPSNVECSHPGDFSIPLEIYVPKSDGLFPAILLIHGGGWKARQIEAD